MLTFILVLQASVGTLSPALFQRKDSSIAPRKACPELALREPQGREQSRTVEWRQGRERSK